MKAPRPHILMLMLIAACLRTACAQEAAMTAANEIVPITQVDTQLRINMTALLEGPSNKGRVDAAILLLTDENPEARARLLDVLSRADNPAARAAVCEALSPTRTWQKPLRSKEDFIKPLIGVITSEQDFAIVRLAAEATLVFGYSQVQLELEKAVMDPSLSVAARTNVIYTMRRHPDKQAVARLFSLVDGSDPQIAEAARSALVSAGIPVSPDPAIRRQMFLELQQRGAESFLRERLIRQETRMREMEAERESWQKKYLTALSNLYNMQGDEGAKIKFLAQYLGAQETRVKVWALDRLEELRQGTSKAKFSELELVLIPLISDPSRDVRLNTAKRLAALPELNAAKPLLEQLNVEQDDQIRRELLVALREACYVGSLATTGRTIPVEIRYGTLAWAARFLNEADAERARIGAEVIGKLLEQNGLKPEDVNGYLKALADRYAQMNPSNDTGLKGYVLNAMAGLCSSRSACREPAAKYFSGFFEQALADKADPVRQIAFDGLVNVNADKAGALRRLRKDLAGDLSPIIRVKLIDLAGEAGGPQDVDWLVEKLGSVDESDPAWQAIVKIFRRSPLAVLVDWAAKIKSPAMAGKLTTEQQISFFGLAEQKAQSETKADVLRDAQVNLAGLYITAGNHKQALEYLKALLAAGPTGQERLRLQGQLLQVYLGLGSIGDACELLGNSLAEKDLDLRPEGSIAKCIDGYLSNPATVNPGALLEGLGRIQVNDPQVRQAWRALLSGWTERYAKAKKTEESDSANN